MENRIKILTIVGARPQFIKSAVFTHSINKDNRFTEVTIHTGQHYDSNMSDIFFSELELPRPDYVLEAGGLNHGAMTGRILEQVEVICVKEQPDLILVYGDTNSTLAGALAGVKLHIPVAHIEAGLRSYNMAMPEEINRILTDRISSILFCPTDSAVNNLKLEGFDHFKVDINQTGDIMFDMIKFAHRLKKFQDPISPYVLATIHRAENTNDINRLNEIILALNTISQDINVKVPLHPRTKKIIFNNKIKISPKVEILEPVGYFEMVSLLAGCDIVISDSGGVQKEAYFSCKNCLILRDETEWTELTQNRNNILVGAEADIIIRAFNERAGLSKDFTSSFYGDGNSIEKITNGILKYFSLRNSASDKNNSLQS